MIFKILFLFFLSANLFSQVRIFPSFATQTEPFVVKHPKNDSIYFLSANTINLNTGFISEGIYISTNFGESWNGSDTCKGAPINFHRGDPAITIDENGVFILLHLGFSPGIFSHYSLDSGKNWSSQKMISNFDQDRASIVSDNFGNTFATWVKFANPFPIYFSFTNDSGKHWSQPQQINFPLQRCQGSEITIGSENEIYICWANVENVSPFTENFVGFAKSTNFGTSWNVSENAFDINGVAGILQSKGNIRINGLPKIAVDKSNSQFRGNIYIVTTEKNFSPAGNDNDIILHRSTDDGASWSNGIRVNQDILNNGKVQYFPAICVDDFGGINIIYYDDRNTTSDSAEIFLSRSTDGGNIWNDFPISNHRFKPQAIGGLGQGYQGDNIAVISSGNNLMAFWMDNFSGTYQIWQNKISLISLSIKNINTFPKQFSLKQNYPNPFNPKTKIKYEIAKSGFVSLKIYDVLGREIKTLVNENKNVGFYEIEFDANNLNSGIYFYKLTTNNFSEMKKMILIK